MQSRDTKRVRQRDIRIQMKLLLLEWNQVGWESSLTGLHVALFSSDCFCFPVALDGNLWQMLIAPTLTCPLFVSLFLCD
jgi:hypothetical protein